MLIIYLLLFLLLIFFAIFYSTQFYNILFRGFAPYINTNQQTINTIISEINIIDQATVYELGCGNAGFLQLLSKKYPQTKLIGFEYAWLPWLIANTQIKLRGIKNIQILHKNFFMFDLKKANVIYCYLNPASMQKLKEKFLAECPSHTQIISNQFPIPGWTPKKIINNNKNKIYFYQQ